MKGSLVKPRQDRSDSEASQRALDSLRSNAQSTENAFVDSLRLRLRELRAKHFSTSGIKIALVVTGVVLSALVCAVVAVRTAQSGTSVQATTSDTTQPVATTTTTGPTVVVDIGGAVRQPGVYRLPVGSRVVDALERAGGPADDIDLEIVNLAAPVTDGQRVWLARKGEAPRVVGPSGGATAPSASAVGPLDLNTATVEQLDALSGIGPATAKAIIDRRTQMGRFRSVDDLLTVKGIGAAKLDSIRASVVVR